MEDKELGQKYITSWERMAIHEGVLKTLRANIAQILVIRFGLPAEITQIIGGIAEVEIFEAPLGKAVKRVSIDAFVEHLPVAV